MLNRVSDFLLITIMMQAVVWFSGISAVNLVDQVPHGRWTEYGCNWFEEWRQVDHICAYDRQIVAQISTRTHAQLWTQTKWAVQPWQGFTLQREWAVSDSGTMACELALQQHDSIYVIGCDWGVTDQSIQDHHYEFRGYQPPKFVKQHAWLRRHAARITWVHIHAQPWMQRYLHYSDFLDLCRSSLH